MILGGHVTLWRRGTFAEQKLFHFTFQELAPLWINESYSVFVDEHGLVCDPALPALFGHIVVNAFPQLARVGLKIQPLGFLLEHDTIDCPRHGYSRLSRSSVLSNFFTGAASPTG